MKLADQHFCTGCGACVAACPKGAIERKDDSEGFPTPYIVEDKCIECGLCAKVCPALNPPKMNLIGDTYAAQILDRDALRESTSGGVFTVFAREIFRRGGVVYGCVWDKDYNAVVTKAESEEEMKPMRGSKYVWSYAGDTFPDIKNYLKEGRIVLFSGLPCQVAGLKKYLGKEYENLFSLDFLCSGSPSPLAFQKYLDTICESPDRSALDLRFRNKNPHGVGVHITYRGMKKPTSARADHIANPYYYSFYSHFIDRRSCYHCPFGTVQRIADFTMGDFWGIADYYPDMDIKAGVSALMVNSEKGIDLLKSVENELTLVKTKPQYIAKKNNLSLTDKPKNRTVVPFRDDFFLELNQSGWKSAEKKYLRNFSRLKKIIILKIPLRFIKLAKKIRK